VSQRKGNAYTFGFAAAVCIGCAFILANAATFLKPTQMANARLDIVVNILGAVGFDTDELKAKPTEDVFALFDKEFKVLLLDGNNKEANRSKMESDLIGLGYPEKMIKELDSGALLTRYDPKIPLLAKNANKTVEEFDPGYKVVYLHQVNGQTDAYVVPIVGYGLWDIIKGYVALDTDLNTIKGITFYEHKETPGLGARITEPWFKENFKGKKILDESGALVSVKVAKGAGSGEHQVDGISGATLTGNGINHFMLADLQKYEPYFKTVRTN
jgi:Na+-transporting NADH:ubiquinone oxidoreductase subunit C